LRYRLNNSFDRSANIRRTSRRFGTLFDRNPFCSGDGAASNWGGMIGHGTGESICDVGVGRVEGQERHYRS
jgi:hypothetical protein